MISLQNYTIEIDDRIVVKDANISFGRKTYLIAGDLYKRKTTLLRDIAASFHNYNPQVRYYSESGIIYLPDEQILINNFTVLQNLNYYSLVFKTNKDYIDVIIKDFDLYQILHKNIRTLTTEHKQMVRIACAMLNEKASVILLDNPFNNLQQSDIDLIKAHLNKFVRIKTIIILKNTIHNLEEFEPTILEFVDNDIKVVTHD